MTQIFFPPSPNVKQLKTYCYVNKFALIAIAKIKGIKNRQCEGVVFPAEKFLFIADDSCELEIHQQTDRGVIKDTIACSELKVIEQ